MNLVIKRNAENLAYFIHNENSNSFDTYIARKLNITIFKYRNILIKFHGYPTINNDEIFFNELIDIKTAIAALEPYLIMYKLTK